MKPGKVSNTVLKRSVLKRIKKRGDILLAKPCIGADCAVLQLKAAESVMLSSASGRWGVYCAANNIAVTGGSIRAVQCGITYPESAEESGLKVIVSEMERQCQELDIPISGGHTEVSAYVTKPVVQITGVGCSDSKTVLDRKSIHEDQQIVAVKAVGVSGIRSIVEMKKEDILKKYTQEVISRAIGSEEELLVKSAVDVARRFSAVYMHDLSQGGIWAGLWDMAEYLGLGFDVNFKAIPVRQEIIELCEIFDVNPYQLESVGGLLIVCDHGNALVSALLDAEIQAAVVGKLTEGNQKIIRNQDEVRYLDSPQPDEVLRFL